MELTEPAIELDDPDSLWAQEMWNAHLHRSPRLFLRCSLNAPRYYFHYEVGLDVSVGIKLRLAQLVEAEEATTVAPEDETGYLRFRCQDSEFELLIFVSEDRFDDEVASCCDLAGLWGWMDRMLVLRQAKELDAHTAPAQKTSTKVDVRH